MSYIGQARGNSIGSISGVDVDVAGVSQKNQITESIVVPSDENKIYFGDTTFSAANITVNGQLIIAGGSPNFSGGSVNITGTLYAY